MMLCFKGFKQIIQIHETIFITATAAASFSSSVSKHIYEINRVARIINNHPFPDQPLEPTLRQHLPRFPLSSTFVENVLGRLFASHSNGLKALEFFRFSLRNSQDDITSDAFEKTLHILVRMRYFDKAWEFMEEIGKSHPNLLTLKSMSIMLSKIAKFQSYEDVVTAFDRMENDVFVGRKFGTEEFNVLLRAFCTEKEMKEARSIFNKMYSRFTPNTKTMNILLLGFKSSWDITAMELFYHEMVQRGFKPDCSTYNIRINAYCKKGCLNHGFRLLEEMERASFLPTLETLTTLIHGAGLARNIIKARELFDEISKRNVNPDIGTYNALITAFLQARDYQSAIKLMEEMEEKNIGHDNITYHTMFLGMLRSNGIEGVVTLYDRMVEKNFVPKTRTSVMLMKFFCLNRRLDLGLNLWEYLIEKGYCPHGHALDLLATGLCSRRKVNKAFDCCKQMLERGRYMSKATYLMLERSLKQSGELDKLTELNELINKLQIVLPPSTGHARTSSEVDKLGEIV
ncbi:hypothetical protein ACFE04_001735 [Oxalis oulophora]